MPGTIQISVLDFKSLDSSSQLSLKVSMGKREYQTWDKGDFSFPLTTLRDNLIITLEDADGNKISHTGLQTRLVVEKGVWDDVFPLEGGGHVHMKLQFVLSEEERQKIQIMRESASKKKHDELRNSGRASPKSASVGHNEVSASVHLTETYQESVPSKLEKVNNLNKQGSSGKADSTVRKMISAFEGSLNQDKPSIKLPPIKPESRMIGVDSFIANQHTKEVETEKIIPKSKTLRRTNTKEYELSITSNKEKATYGSASTTEKAAFSRRMLDKHSKGNQSWNSFSKMQHSSRTLITKHGGEEISQRDQQEAEGTPHEKLKSATTWKWNDDHCCTRRSSGLWIFPGELKCLCITTGGKKVMDLMGGFWDESTKESTGEVNANASEAIEANEDGKSSTQKLTPRPENSREPEESIGPFRQVIRVVIMVGFATLVLLTRKKT